MEHVTEGCTCEGKKCSKCEDVKCVGCFYLRKDGYRHSYCYSCDKEYRTTYRKLHPRSVDHHKYKYPEQSYRYNKKWKQLNRERYLAQHAATNAMRRTRKTQTEGSYTPLEWLELKELYNYTCLCCGKREPEIKLTADHVIPVVKDGTSFISNIQPLCASCNCRKKDKIIDFRPKNP